jgi:IclR family transcriptional regulator, acetate operon repressor
MTAAINRTLSALELLSRYPQGLAVLSVATSLGLAPSAAYRLLNDLRQAGYVRQDPESAAYGLTIRLAGLGLSWLGLTGIPDVCQPILDDLAKLSGELVRLSVSDGERLVWVAFAQGATAGLRYDPVREQGVEASLAYSASGRAWATTLDPDRSHLLLEKQGLTPPDGAAENSRLTMEQVLSLVSRAKSSGHAEAVDCFLAGMAAVAVPLTSGNSAPGCLSIAGPAVRLTAGRRAELLPALRAAASGIAAMLPASALFRGLR